MVRRFLQLEASGGLVLLVVAVVAVVWANSPWSESYRTLWSTEITLRTGGYVLADDLRHWVNDGLMALFFFVVGLEIKRELVHGDLRDRRAAAMPRCEADHQAPAARGRHRVGRQSRPDPARQPRTRVRCAGR